MYVQLSVCVHKWEDVSVRVQVCVHIQVDLMYT